MKSLKMNSEKNKVRSKGEYKHHKYNNKFFFSFKFIKVIIADESVTGVNRI